MIRPEIPICLAAALAMLAPLGATAQAPPQQDTQQPPRKPPGVARLLAFVQEDAAAVLAHAPQMKDKDRRRMEKARNTVGQQAEARARGARLDRAKVNHALDDLEKSLKSPAVAPADRTAALQHIADLRTHTRQNPRPPRPMRPRRGYPRPYPYPDPYPPRY